MASIFTKIIEGEIPSHKVAENESCVAFLDIQPLRPGHTLVVPKKEVNNLFDLPEEDYLALLSFAKKVAKAIERTYDCNRAGLTVIGLEVPHAHVHLIPINTMNDMNFANQKLECSQEELAKEAEKIKNNL